MAESHRIIIDTDSAGDDAAAMACLVLPDFLEETTLCCGSCITAPGETCGMLIYI